jgi:hypothetical protein
VIDKFETSFDALFNARDTVQNENFAAARVATNNNVFDLEFATQTILTDPRFVRPPSHASKLHLAGNELSTDLENSLRHALARNNQDQLTKGNDW